MNNKNHSPHSNHDEVWLLLPWYSNGSLQGKERALVKNHLRVCLMCREELAAQELLAKSLQPIPTADMSTRPSFERLMKRIQDETRSPDKPVREKARRRFRFWAKSLMALMTPRRLTVALVTGLLAVALIISLRWMPVVQNYRTVADAGSLGRLTKNDVRVVFAAYVTERKIADILKSVHGQIVDGPTAAGVYTIRIMDSDGSEISISRSLARLRADEAVILVEPALPRTTDHPDEER